MTIGYNWFGRKSMWWGHGHKTHCLVFGYVSNIWWDPTILLVHDAFPNSQSNGKGPDSSANLILFSPRTFCKLKLDVKFKVHFPHVFFPTKYLLQQQHPQRFHLDPTQPSSPHQPINPCNQPLRYQASSHGRHQLRQSPSDIARWRDQLNRYSSGIWKNHVVYFDIIGGSGHEV